MFDGNITFSLKMFFLQNHQFLFIFFFLAHTAIPSKMLTKVLCFRRTCLLTVNSGFTTTSSAVSWTSISSGIETQMTVARSWNIGSANQLMKTRAPLNVCVPPENVIEAYLICLLVLMVRDFSQNVKLLLLLRHNM